MESSEEIRQKVDLLALAAQWKVEPGAPLPSARSGDDLGTACLAHVHTDSPERSKKLPRPQSPRGERSVPSGYGETSAFSLRARPKARGSVSQRARRRGEAPGAHLLRRRGDPRGRCPCARTPGVQPPRGSKFWPPRLAPCSRHKCTDCGDPRAPRCTYPLSCSLMAARAPRPGEGASGGVSLPEPPGSPKVERRRRRPSSQLKALRRSRRGLAGGRAGGRGAREGALRADGAGLGRAPPPPSALGTRTPRDPAVGAFNTERKDKRKRKKDGGDLR